MTRSVHSQHRELKDERLPLGSRFGVLRLRRVREYLTGYLMVAPAVILIFIFGIFPVGFALYVSLQKWRLKRGDFLGLKNFAGAIGNLAYVAAFALGIAAIVVAILLVIRLRKEMRENKDKAWWLVAIGLLHAAMIGSFARWFVLLLPEVLDIADKIIGVEKTRELFNRLLGEAFRAENVLPAFYIFLLTLGLSIAGYVLSTRAWRNPRNIPYQARFALSWLAVGLGILLIVFTASQVISAYTAALDTGEDPGIWPQIITISSGILLLIAAWFVWRSAQDADSSRGFWLKILSAFALLVGGWLLIGEVPVILAAGDDDLWMGLKATIFYSAGTVPFQLGIALFLAVMLFQKLRGSELFRMMYFLTYVTPTVASAAVFRQLFSSRQSSLINQILKVFGMERQFWLQEPSGVFTMIGESLGISVPEWAAGPSLALVVIMIFSIWVYVGYDTVIYLAGLGNISTELIEAAEIDGAGRWAIFRNVIFPLLSPTTYFLSLMAIIGTFKAFQHIWVLRNELALRTSDTFSVTIFVEFFDKVRYGYASALAFVLLAIIVTLTIINNRVQGSRVFYG
ncbi:MAG TPA: sugar ABC transporter permease [Anaerolineae bacterium]|nr:sugar ABC transporter permease [Anaerolineae bacterium]